MYEHLGAAIDELLCEMGAGDYAATGGQMAATTGKPADSLATGEQPPAAIDARDLDVLEVWYCAECEQYHEDAGPALYGCGECGDLFNRDNSADGDSHRCPSCGKFGAKVADCSCPDCTGGEVESVVAVWCPICDEAVAADEAEGHFWEDHGCKVSLEGLIPQIGAKP